ncbi:MAG: chromosomal replication initiator DnaA [Robiginitomaculum sp.]|nr:MAG: chromosomal replication initiator DnaA [Robiginitomaculum sp.]
MKTTNSDLALAQLVAAAVAIEFGVASPRLFSKTKGPSHLSFARQVAMYLVHIVYQINLSRVARSFSRDRSTVSYACNVIEDCREDPYFDEKLTRLERFLDAEPLPAMLGQTG